MTIEAGALARQPVSLKELQNNKFRFMVYNLPAVNYTCQKAILPGITMKNLTVPNPNTNMKFPGTVPEFSDFEVNFFVDQNLQNYLEVFNWIQAQTFPKAGEQRTSYIATRERSKFRTPLYPMFSDATLFIYSTQNTLLMEVAFKDLYPYQLSQLEFDSRENAEPLVAGVRFEYLSYEFIPRMSLE